MKIEHNARALKHFVLVLFTFFACKQADAQWVKAGSFGEATVYIKRAEISKDGVIVQAPIMHDYQSAQADPVSKRRYMSSEAIWAFDCRNVKYKHLIFTEYSGSNLTGERIAIVDFESSLGSRNEWKSPTLGSAANYFTQTVCEFAGFR